MKNHKDKEIARSDWETAKATRIKLEKELFQPGSGYGDPCAQKADEHRLECARYEEQARYQIYKDLEISHEEIFELKPNFYGIGLDLKKLFHRICKIFRRSHS